ncbi:MAG: beta-lactamase family protein [Anaerolineales bacterium]|nr:beta-lactamase family protein [Anaerolineales bacterium]
MKISKPEKAGFSSRRLQRITSWMQGYVARGELAGWITTVARNGRTVYYGKSGWMDVEARKPMQDDTIFQIMSMTKPVTSVAAMILYEEGRFDLNTPLTEFFPAFKDTKVFVGEMKKGGLQVEPMQQPILLRHLFTHTAGFSYGSNQDDPVDRAYQKATRERNLSPVTMTSAQFVEALAQLPLAFQPGTHWRYGLAIELLGCLVELVSGKPLDVYMQEHIFDPLGMTDTAFQLLPEKAGRLALVYDHPVDGQALRRRDDLKPPAQRPCFFSGGGGLVSTIGDYARFCQMLVNRGALDGVRLLSPRSVAMYAHNQAPAAALPYRFDQNDRNHLGYGYSLATRVLIDVAASGRAGSLGEFGWDGAFNTYFWIDPQEDLYGLMMVQTNPGMYYPIAPQFKILTYQALVD